MLYGIAMIFHFDIFSSSKKFLLLFLRIFYFSLLKNMKKNKSGIISNGCTTTLTLLLSCCPVHFSWAMLFCVVVTLESIPLAQTDLLFYA